MDIRTAYRVINNLESKNMITLYGKGRKEKVYRTNFDYTPDNDIISEYDDLEETFETNNSEKKNDCQKSDFDDIDAITPTYGPGLVGALLVGLSYAKALSFAIDKPLVGVNHIQGHIAANYITYKELKPPFLCVMMSGGNTQLVHVKNYTEFEVLGKTRDDAIGEAFDKVARVVGLGYPGGPKIDKLAKDGNPNSIELPKTHFENLDFSFSGIKTAVINLHHKTPDINKADLCASFEKTVTEILMENTKKALKQINVSTVALAGGVSANSYIRNEFLKLQDIGIKVYMPDLKLCTDNAAMIASAGYYNFIEGNRSSLDLNAIPNLKLQKK